MSNKAGYIRRYRNSNEVLEHLNRVPHPEAGNESRKEPRERWDLGLGYDECVRMYREGWKEGVTKANDLRREIDILPAKGPRLAFQHSVAGAYPDVPAYLAGDPENMLTPTWEDTGQGVKYLTMYVPINFPCSVDARDALMRGVAQAVLVDALEDAGVRVRLIGYSFSSSMYENGAKYATLFDLKDFDEPFNLSNLIYAVAHPGMLRRVWFALAERMHECEAQIQDTQGGYGRPSCPKHEQIGAEPDDLIVPGIHELVTRSKGTATDHLKTLLEWMPAEISELITE